MSSVVIPQQDEVRVYPNEGGGITIEQIGRDGDEAVIWIDYRHAEALCKAIRAAAKDIRNA